MRANFDINVIGMFLGMKTVIPGMIELGGGAIVNVSSVWGWSGIKNNVAYQTAKGAAVMLSKNAAVTYAPIEHPHQLRPPRLCRHADVAHGDAGGGEDADGVHAARPPRRAGGACANVRLPRLRRVELRRGRQLHGRRRDGGAMSERRSPTFRARRLRARFRRHAARTRGSPTRPTARSTPRATTSSSSRPGSSARHLDVEWLIGEGKAARHDEVLRRRAAACSRTACPRRRRTRRRLTTAARFPAITIQDNVRAQHRLLTETLRGRARSSSRSAARWAPSRPTSGASPIPTWSSASRRCCGAAQVSRHCFVFLDGAKAALLGRPGLCRRRLHSAARNRAEGARPRLGGLGAVAAILPRQLYGGWASTASSVPGRFLGGLLGPVRRQRPAEPAPYLADRRHRGDTGL